MIMMTHFRAGITPAVALAALALPLAPAVAQIGILGPSNVKIEYRRDSSQVLPTTSYGAANNAWLAPSNLLVFTVTDPLGPGASNVYQAFVNHSFNNLGGGQYSLDALPLFSTVLAQTDPTSAFAQTEMRMDFSIDLLWGASFGTTFVSAPLNYSLLYIVPPGGNGSYSHTINYTSSVSSFSTAIMPSQVFNFSGPFAGSLPVTAAGSAYVGTPGETIRVTGSMIFRVDNHTGPSEIRVIPAPGGAAMVAGLGGLLLRRSRRR